MYSLDAYLQMIADRHRTEAYEDAIRRAVSPGAVVVDIGTGPGIMAMLACRHGARHVYAIEPESIAQVAREVIRANGLAEKITVIEKRSVDVTLPEKADIIVSDLRGILPLHSDHIPSIVDARQRFLETGGSLIPARDRIFAAVVEDASLHSRQLLDEARHVSGFDFDSTMGLLTSTWTKAEIKPGALLGEPGLLAQLDYEDVTSPDITGTTEIQISRDGTAHGITLWFDTELFEGVGFSNAPGEPDLVYGRAFFPLSTPQELREGESVRLAIEARLVKGSYLWVWKSEILANNGTVRVRLDQSNLGGSPVLASKLRRHSEAYAPSTWKTRELDLAILSLIDGTRSNGAIASEVQQLAGSFEDALDRVAELVDLLT